ncbi:MAG: type II toxin-antitoxin system CcdA family antitoxin [Solirubrobacteraceae bacterium]|nr:type II toxin-antitoxin system CcdA family antitoxin [Solirubrobacteraceae bacterium]
MQKRRLTVTVDADVAEAVRSAVDSGAASSVSAWVDEALVARLERDRRSAELGAFLDAYEAEHGAFDDDELAEIERRSTAGAVHVRGPGGAATGPSSGAAAA